MSSVAIWVASIGAIAAVAGAGVAGYSAYQQGEQQEAMGDYNAEVAEQEAIMAKFAIEEESRNLSEAQRDLKARQRMSIGARGGMMAGTDLMKLANEVGDMQKDQLELRRETTIAGIQGKAQGALAKYQGKMAKTASRWTIGSSVAQGVGGVANAGAGYMSYKAK